MPAHRRTHSRKRLIGRCATGLAFGLVVSLAPATQAAAAQSSKAQSSKAQSSKAQSSKAQTATATTGKSTTGKTATAKTPTGKSTTSKTTTGKTTTGKTTTGKTTTGKTTTGKTTTGQATTGQATTGQATTAPTPVVQPALEGDGSYYVTSDNPQLLYDMGCQDGTSDAQNAAAQRLTILDFGGQYANGSGTEPVLGPAELTNSQIEQLAANYAAGWHTCIGGDGSSVLTLGVGTNNSLSDVTGSGGATWAQVVADVAAAEAGISDQVVVDGADDIETEFSTPGAALGWAAGYSAAGTGGVYLDYGDAGGCPETTYDNGACNNGWDQYDVWAVSWGEPAALPMPEIYYPANAAQWTRISQYGKASLDGAAISFSGDLSEYAADPTTLNPTQSWSVLAGYLNDPTETAGSAQWLSDIRYETQ